MKSDQRPKYKQRTSHFRQRIVSLRSEQELIEECPHIYLESVKQDRSDSRAIVAKCNYFEESPGSVGKAAR